MPFTQCSRRAVIGLINIQSEPGPGTSWISSFFSTVLQSKVSLVIVPSVTPADGLLYTALLTPGSFTVHAANSSTGS